MGNDVAINMGGALGNFELNVMKPLIIHNFLRACGCWPTPASASTTTAPLASSPTASGSMNSVTQSLMLVTALNPHIGYDNAAKIAKNAHAKGITLRDAASELGLVKPEEFDRWVRPEDMVGN